ncbi:MAG: hypothetical protein HKO90_02635, partial [Flavobacteriaceae bacterium]|nr:hypothetical protein [Flavobacteriaceae bacterium]
VPNWTEIKDLIDVLIWPLTLIICFMIFRKQLRELIGKVGSFKATKDGLEMTFQDKLESIQTLPALKAVGGISKSGGQIKIKGSKAKSPYEELLELRDVLNSKIVGKARGLKIETDNMSNIAISDKLKEVGGITLQQAKAFKALIDLTNSASPKITQAQVNEVRSLVNNLDI